MFKTCFETKYGDKFVNLSPHDINILMSDGSLLTIPRSGYVARTEHDEVVIRSDPFDISMAENIRVVILKDGVRTNIPMPEPSPHTWYIVSYTTAKKLARPDIMIPSGLIKDGQGRVEYCERLSLAGERCS